MKVAAQCHISFHLRFKIHPTSFINRDRRKQCRLLKGPVVHLRVKKKALRRNAEQFSYLNTLNTHSKCQWSLLHAEVKYDQQMCEQALASIT